MECLAAEEPAIDFRLRCRSASPSHSAASAASGPGGRASPAATRQGPFPGPRVAGRVSVLGRGEGRSAADGPSPHLPPRSPSSTNLPLWPASHALQQLCALAGELKAAWISVGAEDAARLADTDAIASAAIAELRPRLEGWRRQAHDLEEQCGALRAQVQEGVEELNGEFLADLCEADNLPLYRRLPALQRLAAEVTERRRLASELRAERSKLLQVFGRALANDARQSVPELQAQIDALESERRARLDTVSEVVRGIQAIFEELSIVPSGGIDLQIMSSGGFGMADSEYAALLERHTFWEGEHGRLLAARGSAQHVRAIWQELGEQPEAADEVVLAVLQDGSWTAGLTLETISQLDQRRTAWEARRGAALAELQRLHAALRSFGGPGLANVIITAHDTVHSQDREACREKLKELQAALLEAEKPMRERLAFIYNKAGMDLHALEAFYNSLEEVESAELRQRRLEEELDRAEKYFDSVHDILGQLEELKTLVLEGSKFEAARAAEKDRFSGNSLHFLEEEKFRKMFARRYPQLRDALIGKIEAWEAARHAQFVYRGSAVREKLLAMRGMEADLLHIPGDLGLLGMLLQMLDVQDVSVVSKRPNHARPPRDPANDHRPSPAPSAVRGRSRNPPASRVSSRASSPQAPQSQRGGNARTPTPPRKSLSVPGGAA